MVQDGKMEYNDLRKSRLHDRFSIHKGTQTEYQKSKFWLGIYLKTIEMLLRISSFLLIISSLLVHS